MTALASLRPIADSTLRGQTVDRLRDLIVSGQVGAGVRLTETHLAKALGISRGPLREAIRELVDIGLLVSQPYKGIFVRSVTRRDIEEVYSLRTALEQFAFKQCWAKRTPEALANLRARHRALTKVIDSQSDPFGAIERELELHGWCYEVSGHTLLQKSWTRLRPNLQFYFVMHQQAHGRLGPRREAHDVYIDRACGDDLEAMLAHLEDHMQQGLKTTITFIEAME